jgi:hypothetical protein
LGHRLPFVLNNALGAARLAFSILQSISFGADRVVRQRHLAIWHEEPIERQAAKAHVHRNIPKSKQEAVGYLFGRG